MKFTIHRQTILEALQGIQSIVEKKSTVQIISNVLCEINEDHLFLSATDLEVGIRIKLPVENTEKGKLTIPAKQFFEIIKELPNQKINISSKSNNWVQIDCDKNNFNIVSLDASEFPSLPDFENKEYFSANVENLKGMIDRTLFAISLDATRYTLNGVYLEQNEDHLLRMVATDGHRLSYVDCPVFEKEAPKLKRGIIIPKKGLIELRKFLDRIEGNFDLCLEKGFIFTRTENSFLFVRLIEGEYPNYRQVIPNDAKKVIYIKKNEFFSSLKRANLLANEKSRGVKLSIEKNKMTVISSNPDMGDARSEINIKYEEDAFEIGFNAKYLLEYLAVVNFEEMEISLKDRLSPGILKVVDKNDHTYVIMPMRI